ncbi:hypothetical protein [Dyadobacter sp. CY323]|uniref:hypothetical protein n=1 Tax=Dyadobacter sp. CY323 TaxID=2907302 RepID=UPI001F203DD3|nr:hypothetical protein [Dyadobacter sp. CY323]MCE6992023.1 hypothetical protein [Dyadobacter sp. CY323]
MDITAFNTKKESDEKRHVAVELPSTSEATSRTLSRKAQEAKIFLERNPIPKEFLKS